MIFLRRAFCAVFGHIKGTFVGFVEFRNVHASNRVFKCAVCNRNINDHQYRGRVLYYLPMVNDQSLINKPTVATRSRIPKLRHRGLK